jgi:uncharacterized protein DUF222
LSVRASILEYVFESEACVADWERTGRVPVPALLLTPPDLTVWAAAGPPLADEFADECLAIGEDAGLRDGLVGDAGGGADGGDDVSARDARRARGGGDGVGAGEAALDEGDRDADGVGCADAVASSDPLAPVDVDGDTPFADSADWAGLAPGVDLATLLTAVDLPELSEFGLVEAVAGWERLAGWVAAEQTLALAELARRPLFTQLSSFRDGIDAVSAVGMEVSARLRVSHREADTRVEFAQELTGHRRATFDALHAGRVDVRRARMLVDGVGVLGDAAATGVEARLLPDAGEHTPASFRRRVERAVAAADPAGFEDRHARAAEDRQVRCRPEPDGMGSLWALLPAADAAMINTVLDAAADAAKHDHPDDARSHAQRRADALAHMAWAAWQAGHLGCPGCRWRLARAQGRRVEIGVLVPYATLIGLSEAPGEIDGFGPIPASVARRLAAAGTWRRLLTDPATGRVLDYGNTRYRPPQDLIDHVIARDRTCRGIGCDRPARSCQIDHTIPYPDGPTAEGNTGPFCDRQHLFKTHGGWQVRQPIPGQFVWRTLTGHTYNKLPDPIGPIIHEGDDHADGAGTDNTPHPEDPDPPPF